MINFEHMKFAILFVSFLGGLVNLSAIPLSEPVALINQTVVIKASTLVHPANLTRALLVLTAGICFALQYEKFNIDWT